MFNISVKAAIGGGIFAVLAMITAGSFVIAAVQGDFGVMRRVQIRAEAEQLRQERDALTADLAQIKNLTHRLSDDYLDLDLLDERARIVLGYLRSDEIVIR